MMSDSESTDDEQVVNVVNIDCSPVCRYGSSCYRLNPLHFRQFRHPHLTNDSTSRVVRETVELEIEIGHNSSLRPQINLQGHTHDWTAFVRPAGQQPIDHLVQKVVFRPPAPFTHMQTIADKPPFFASMTGIRSYKLSIEIHFVNRGEPLKTQLDYDLYLKENASYSTVRRVKLSFQNPSIEFRDKLLTAGGVILQVPDSSTSVAQNESPEVTTTSTNKRRRGNEGESSNSSKDDYDVFGQLCASKLRRIDESSPNQKVLAEKLITEVLFHAQQKALLNDSSINPTAAPSVGESSSLPPQNIEAEVLQNGNVPQQTIKMEVIPQPTIKVEDVPQQTIKTEISESHCAPQEAMETQVPESSIQSQQSIETESNSSSPVFIKQEIE